MKLSLNDIIQMDALWVWVLCLLTIVVGPSLHIHHQAPLQSWEHRCLALFVILALWLVGKIILLPSTHRQNSSDQAALKNMRSHGYHVIKQAFSRLIKQRSITPYYLVIGNQESGKSALIESFGAHAIASSPWWQHNDAFFFEYDSEQSPTILKKLLATTLRVAKAFMPMAGVIICLDIHKLYQSHSREQKQSLANIHALLQMIHTTHQSCPITIVCTKSDLISGFQPTFSDAMVHDNHCLGLSANLPAIKENIQAFISKLYDFATTQTQQEHDFFNKQKIMDFPRQIDSIKEAIETMVIQMAQNTHLKLNSLCFVSVMQKQQPIDYLAKPIEQSYQIHGQSHETMPTKQHYFANSLYQHIQSHGRHTIAHRNKRVTQWFMLSMMVLLANVALFQYLNSAPEPSALHPMIIPHQAIIAATPEALLTRLNSDIQSQSASTLADLVAVIQSNKKSHRQMDEKIMQSSIHVIRQALPMQLYQLAMHLLAQDQQQDANNTDALYNQNAFAALSQHIAPQSTELMHTLMEPQATPQQSKQEQDTLLQSYLNHYTAYWEKQSQATTIQSPQNIQGAIQWLSTLSDAHSPWRQHMQLAYQQTKANQSPLFNKTVSDHFSWLQDWQQNAMAKTERQAGILSTALKQSQSAPNPDAVLFGLSQKIALNPEQSSIGQILQSHNQDSHHMQWIDDGIHQVWQLMLSKTADYINQQWLVVYQQINPMITKQFPFDPKANTDIPANQFTTIFKVNGTLDRFFDLYLLAFTDQNKNYWHWKPLFGNTIPLHQDQLEQFIRAHLIQDMFFPTNHPSIDSTFSLTPLGLPDNIKTIRITLGNQSITYDQDAIPMMQLSWPGQPPYGINLQINQLNGVQVNYMKPGFWGLFHLMANHSEYDMDQQQSRITFKVNGESIHLLLSSKASPNPFIPDVLNQFRLQPKL